MSKTKINLEELLKESLIPEEIQSYKVFNNWVWVNLGSVIELISGRDISAKECNDTQLGTPYIMGASNIKDNELVIERWIEKPSVLGKEGDILISVKGTIGKLIIQDIEHTHLSRQIMAIRGNNKVHNKYLYYFIVTYIDKLKELSRGVIPGISREDILNAPFPLVPVNEQIRLVDKIEYLLSKVDEAKKLIKEAKESFELRRAAILDKAFRGELTEQWRSEVSNINPNEVEEYVDSLSKSKVESPIKSNTMKISNVEANEELYSLPINWKWVKLGELAYYITSGSRDWSKYYNETGAHFIRTQDINKNRLDMTNVAFVNLPDNVEGKRSLVEPFDILTTITGANVGKCALVNEKIPEAYVSQSVALTKLIDKSIAQYVHLSLLSNVGGGGELEERAYGIGRPVLSLEDIKNIKIPLAPKEERVKIVKIVKELMGKEDMAKSIMNETSLNSLEASVLNKAFQGELGTNNPTEENAIELLKEILQDKKK